MDGRLFFGMVESTSRILFVASFDKRGSNRIFI